MNDPKEIVIEDLRRRVEVLEQQALYQSKKNLEMAAAIRHVSSIYLQAAKLKGISQNMRATLITISLAFYNFVETWEMGKEFGVRIKRGKVDFYDKSEN